MMVINNEKVGPQGSIPIHKRELHVTCSCGDVYNHAIHVSLWDDDTGYVLFSVGVRPEGIWERLKVSLKYLFAPGHWNDWSDAVLDKPKLDELTEFLVGCQEEVQSRLEDGE